MIQKTLLVVSHQGTSKAHFHCKYNKTLGFLSFCGAFAPLTLDFCVLRWSTFGVVFHTMDGMKWRVASYLWKAMGHDPPSSMEATENDHFLEFQVKRYATNTPQGLLFGWVKWESGEHNPWCSHFCDGLVGAPFIWQGSRDALVHASVHVLQRRGEIPWFTKYLAAMHTTAFTTRYKLVPHIHTQPFVE